MKTIAVLALQGAFIEHEKAFHQLGANTIELRQKSDLQKHFDALVLPGGESTVQGKLLNDLDMFSSLRDMIRDGLPVMATCAGLILLAEHLYQDPTVWFGTLHATVRRNAYGRQLGSFFTTGDCGPLKQVPMTFIRAPYIESAEPDVKVLASCDGHITAVQQGSQFAMSFHPELLSDHRIHSYFLEQL